MKRAIIVGGALAALLVLIVVSSGERSHERKADIAAAASRVTLSAEPPAAPAATHDSSGFLYGRVHTVGGPTYEGRLRWGGGEEAFWSDHFNGFKVENPWAVHVPPARLPRERRPIVIFGFEIARRERPVDLGRQFLARFGDIARLEARGRDVLVTLKSGSRFTLDRFSASDFDDGLRVWHAGGVVDLDSLQIQSLELLPTPRLDGAPGRLHGTVRGRWGELAGFVAWNREQCVGTDELVGRTADGELRLRFDAIRAIERRSPDSSRVTLHDGRDLVLSGARDFGRDNRGVFVDDRRFGRVLVSWEAFERLELSEARASGSGPAYDDFAPGRRLTGSVATRDGRRLSGQLIFDLDESETSDTLDASSLGVDYNLPFERIRSIVRLEPDERGARRARVTLEGGDELELEGEGDLGEGNLGMLIFAAGGASPDYLPWTEVERIDFDRPPTREPSRTATEPAPAAPARNGR